MLLYTFCPKYKQENIDTTLSLSLSLSLSLYIYIYIMDNNNNNGYGGGSWSMIPNIGVHSNPATPSSTISNQDHLFLQQQQFQQQQPQQIQQQFHQQIQPQQQYQQQQTQTQQRFQQQQSLASHFHILQLVENLADVIENGSRDQHSDAVIAELNGQFEKCQQLLNSISVSINAKTMTVEGQKHKLAENEQLLNQRKDVMAKYRNSIEELIKSGQ